MLTKAFPFKEEENICTMLIRKVVRPGAKADGLLSRIYVCWCTEEETWWGWGDKDIKMITLSALGTPI